MKLWWKDFENEEDTVAFNGASGSVVSFDSIEICFIIEMYDLCYYCAKWDILLWEIKIKWIISKLMKS